MTAAPAARIAAPPHFAARIGAFFAGYFFINGIAVPWFPVWLESRGLTEVEIASVIAIPLAFRVLVTPIGGFVADRAPSRRFAARLFLVPAAAAFALAWTAHTYWPLLLFTGAAFTFWQLALPAGEALALTGVRRFGFDYGRMRLWGSVAFIIANVGSGALLGFLPLEAIFWFIVGAFAVASGAAFLLPLTPRTLRALDDANRPARKPAWKILGHPWLLAPILAGGLINGSHALFYSFGSIYWQSLGFSPAEIGGFWAVAVGCEILFFVWSTATARLVGPYGMLLLGAAAATVRWILFASDISALGFVLAQSLHALSFGAVFVGTQYIVVRSVPEELAASAQSIVFLVSGLIMAGLTALSGPIYEGLGADGFWIMACLPVLALLVLGLQRLFLTAPAEL